MATHPRKVAYLRPRPLAAAAWTMAGVMLATVCLAGEPPPASSLPLKETTSLVTAIVKVFGSLIVVIGLMLLLLKLLKHTGLGSGRGRAGSAITVLETRMVAPKKYIAIVEIAGHCLALGITDHTITRLVDLDPETRDRLASPPPAGGPGSTFAGQLQRSMQSWRHSATRQGGAGINRTPDEESP